VAAWLLAGRQVTGSRPPGDGGGEHPPAQRPVHDAIDRALAQ